MTAARRRFHPNRPRPRREGVVGLAVAIVAALLLAVADPSHAAEPPKKAGAAQAFDISPVGVPVISNGRLVNYVFVALRLNIRPGLDPTIVAKKEPFFRDALVRLSHRTALNPPRDFNQLDDRTLKARMMAESVRIAGPGVVTSVEILSQAPQHHLDPPTP